MNWLFARYKWWRKWKGGVWWGIDIPAVGGLIWVNKRPVNGERICTQEDYTGENTNTLSERELCFCVCTISVNGQWKDEMNLAKFIQCAKLMQDTGINSSLIIEHLDELYRAAQRESWVFGESYSFGWEEMEVMLERCKH